MYFVLFEYVFLVDAFSYGYLSATDDIRMVLYF